MRSLIIPVLGFSLLFAACDRESAEEPQDNVIADGAEREAPTGIPGGNPGPSYGGSEAVGMVSTDTRGMATPDVVFSDPDGQDMRLSDFRGQPVLVNLWATWCAPCISELPTLDQLAERYDGRVKVLTISQDLQGAEAVVPFLAERNFRHLEPWLDEENAMMAAISSGTLPVTILYDSDGAELFRVTGGMDWAGERADNMIAEALGR